MAPDQQNRNALSFCVCRSVRLADSVSKSYAQFKLVELLHAYSNHVAVGRTGPWVTCYSGPSWGAPRQRAPLSAELLNSPGLQGSSWSNLVKLQPLHQPPAAWEQAESPGAWEWCPFWLPPLGLHCAVQHIIAGRETSCSLGRKMPFPFPLYPFKGPTTNLKQIWRETDKLEGSRQHQEPCTCKKPSDPPPLLIS